MAKKDFSSIDTKRGEAALQQIRQATSIKGQQAEASQEEAAERAAELRTQGRKGCKAIRINLAFTPDNHEFIKVMARISGQTMTQFTNLVVERYRAEHPELYDQAKAIIDNL